MRRGLLLIHHDLCLLRRWSGRTGTCDRRTEDRSGPTAVRALHIRGEHGWSAKRQLLDHHNTRATAKCTSVRACRLRPTVADTPFELIEVIDSMVSPIGRRAWPHHSCTSARTELLRAPISYLRVNYQYNCTSMTKSREPAAKTLRQNDICKYWE